MIFKWGDASTITLSSSFDKFSFHGDTTFPITVKSVQMHITAKICGGSTKHQSCPDERWWGGGCRFPAQKDNRTWLEQRWFQGPEGPSRTVQADAQSTSYKYVSVNSFSSGGKCLFFLCSLCLCVFVRGACRPGTGSALQERICGGDMPAGGTMPYLSWSTKRADMLISGGRRSVSSPPGKHCKVQSSFLLPQCKKKK